MRFTWLAAALMAAVVLAGCQTRAPRNETEAPPDDFANHPVIAIQEAPVPIAQQMAGQTGVVEMAVTARGYEPAQLTVGLNDRVQIHLVNRDSKEHNLVLERWGIITAPLAPGAETYIEFTASEKGAWPIFSDAPGVAEAGYDATLQVE